MWMVSGWETPCAVGETSCRESGGWSTTGEKMPRMQSTFHRDIFLIEWVSNSNNITAACIGSNVTRNSCLNQTIYTNTVADVVFTSSFNHSIKGRKSSIEISSHWLLKTSPGCTHLCCGHVSIKVKVSLFAVSLLTHRPKASQWQAREGKNSTCQMVQNTTGADEFLFTTHENRMGMHWCVSQQLVIKLTKKNIKKKRREKAKKESKLNRLRGSSNLQSVTWTNFCLFWRSSCSF